MLPTTWEPETTFDWKIKIEPENFLLKMDNNFSNLHLFFGFHVNFQGCMTRLGELESNTMVFHRDIVQTITQTMHFFDLAIISRL